MNFEIGDYVRTIATGTRIKIGRVGLIVDIDEASSFPYQVKFWSTDILCEYEAEELELLTDEEAMIYKLES